MRIAVAGATGLVGRHLVRELAVRGHEIVPLARSTGVDLVRGVGLEGRLEGTDGIVDVTNVATASRRASVAFFGAVSEQLLAAAKGAGIGHYVALSIVGIDRVGLGYYQGKLRQEELVDASGVPSTILRATQFHEFAGQILGRMRIGPVAAVPKMRVQPVAVREVAIALADTVLDRPRRRAPDLAGPTQHELVDMARELLRARRHRRIVVAIRIPGAAGRAMRAGCLLPQAPFERGQLTFEQWLDTEDGRAWR